MPELLLEHPNPTQVDQLPTEYIDMASLADSLRSISTELVPDVPIPVTNEQQPDPNKQASFLRRIASTRLGRLALGGMAALGLASGGVAMEASPAFADSNPVYTVTNHDNDGTNGFYARKSPHWNDSDRRLPYYAKYGDKIELICGTNGDPTGPYNNHRWHLVKDLNNPAAGEFFIDDHDTNTPNKANQATPEERECGGGDSTTTTVSSSTSNSSHESVFFSPNDNPEGGVGVQKIASTDLAYNKWAIGNCTPDRVLSNVPSNVETIAGWSDARMGIVYYLSLAGKQRLSQLHNIVLFDPGSTSDFAGRDYAGVHIHAGCDIKYPVNSLLADWLKSDGNNRLTIITGKVSEMKTNDKDPNSKSTYEGLWKYYLADTWNQPFANRAQVCDYNNMGHADVLKNFAWMVSAPRAGCTAIKGYQLTIWNP